MSDNCDDGQRRRATLDRRRPRLTKSSAPRGPGYFIPRTLYNDLAWISALRGWGGSESAIGLKAFFLRIDILYLRDAVSYHLFRKKFPYTTTWDEIWRNQALIARVCFDDRTWYDYWLPELFDEHLTDQARRDLDSDEVLTEHNEFLARKVRNDRDFWRELLKQPEPACLQP